MNAFEADGDLSRIYGKATANSVERTYANSFSYTPDGRIEKLRLGNYRWEWAKFNERLQVTELNLGSGVQDASLWKLKYEYGELSADGTSVDTSKNTGNIARLTTSFSGLANPFVQTFKYDSLYRLVEAKEKSGTNENWKELFSYDRYGNRIGYEKYLNTVQQTLDNKTHPTINPATNRFNTNQGYTYDLNGNLIADAEGRNFTFNGDNKQSEIQINNSPIGRYFYDGEGKRVKKITNFETVIFVYDGLGKLIAEYSTAIPPQNPTTSYTATDMLGSPRVITDSQGNVTSRRDFMPFGEELANDPNYRTAALKYNTGDSIRQKFTGYQKDEETQLDFAEARMYENRHARFTAVDPLLASGKSANPQTFNRYVYCLNNPLIFTDPTGLQAGSWYMPVTPNGIADPTRSYEYIKNGDSTNGYREVTERNKAGDLIGSFAGGETTGLGGHGPYDYVVRFNPNGPRDQSVPLQQIDVNTGGVSDIPLSDYERYGWEIIQSDSYYRNHLATGAVYNAIEPHDVAFALTPFKISVLGKSPAISRSGSLLEDRATELHNLLKPIAQNRRTTAVLEGVNADGKTLRIVASSQNRLDPIQRSALGAGEIEAIGAGHAEITAIREANRLGLTQMRIGVSRQICPFCAPSVVENGIVPETRFRMLYYLRNGELK